MLPKCRVISLRMIIHYIYWVPQQHKKLPGVWDSVRTIQRPLYHAGNTTWSYWCFISQFHRQNGTSLCIVEKYLPYVTTYITQKFQYFMITEELWGTKRRGWRNVSSSLTNGLFHHGLSWELKLKLRRADMFLKSTCDVAIEDIAIFMTKA